jgi:hypothetical protein
VSIDGGAGAVTSLTDAVSGSTSGALYLSQSATGGAGGESEFSPVVGGAGGNATSTLTFTDGAASSLSGTVNASGGAGGNVVPGIGAGGNGGNATVSIALASTLNGVNVSSTGNATGGTAGTGPLQGSPGAANATASASAVGSGIASANSTAVGTGGGEAAAISTSSYGAGKSVMASATSPIGGPASAVTQTTVGGAISLPNAISPGQSFSVVSAFAAGPLTIALGSMGAGYGGTGESLTYQVSANFVFDGIGKPFVIDLLGSSSLGNGFDSATFKITSNGNLIDSQSFTNLALAEAFFSNDLMDFSLGAGPDNVQIAFDETMSSGEGFGFDYATASASATPLPPSWTMILIGLAGLGFVAYRQQKQNPAIAAA